MPSLKRGSPIRKKCALRPSVVALLDRPAAGDRCARCRRSTRAQGSARVADDRSPCRSRLPPLAARRVQLAGWSDMTRGRRVSHFDEDSERGLSCTILSTQAATAARKARDCYVAFWLKTNRGMPRTPPCANGAFLSRRAASEAFDREASPEFCPPNGSRTATLLRH